MRYETDAAYAQYVLDFGDTADIPSSGADITRGEDGESYVVLENIRGILAVYRIVGEDDNGHIAVLVPDSEWPADVVEEFMDPEEFDEVFTR